MRSQTNYKFAYNNNSKQIEFSTKKKNNKNGLTNEHVSDSLLANDMMGFGIRGHSYINIFIFKRESLAS